MTLENILIDCKKQLTGALNYNKHPFRYFTLASTSKDGTPSLRTVVLRDFCPKKFLLTIFTDARSKKVEEFKSNKMGKFLFYDTSRLIQIIIEVKMIEVINLDNHFKTLPEPSKKDYTSITKPGTKIQSPDKVKYNYSQNYFRKIIFQAVNLEYLKLKRPTHIRATFSSEDEWKGSYLVP